MPLPGGAADKISNRFETYWTVYCMLDVLEGQASSIRLEPPGTEGEGVEFWIQKGETREYHQVKRQQSDQGFWKLTDLNRENILKTFYKKVQNGSRCIFVSFQDAYQLRELAERSRDAANFAEYQEEFLKAKKKNADFVTLCNLLGNESEENVFVALQNIRVETISESFLLKLINEKLKTLVKGKVDDVIDFLSQYAIRNVHHEITTFDIWRYLMEEKRVLRLDYASDSNILAKIEQQNQRYIREVESKQLLSNVIRRTESNDITNLLLQDEPFQYLVVSGVAGGGKSNVLLEVINSIRQNGMPFLTIRLDRLDPSCSVENLGEQLDLPASPIHILKNIAQGKKCLLVIDQLDAVSLISGRNPEFFECVSEMIEQAKQFPNVKVLLACRKFDLENDYRMRSLLDDKLHSKEVIVPHLEFEQIKETLISMGMEEKNLRQKQLRLLSLPLHLNLLSEIVGQDESHMIPFFETANDLFRLFWDRKQQLLKERLGRPVQWKNVMDTVCEYMSENQVLYAPEYVVDGFEEDLKAMISEHVLGVEDGKISFFHENFFDYTFARNFLRKKLKLTDYLINGEQHLFRRAQVRQVLSYEREVELKRYLLDIESILNNSEIRIHLKQVVFSLVVEIHDPKETEWNVLRDLMSDSNEPITRYVWGVLRSKAWAALLYSLGVFEKWLNDTNSDKVDETIIVLTGLQKVMPGEAVDLLRPYVGVSDKWNERIRNFFLWSDYTSSQEFFEFVLLLFDTGVLKDKDLIHFAYSLADKHPEWTINIIVRCIKEQINSSTNEQMDSLRFLNLGMSPPYMSKLAEKNPDMYMANLLPLMLEAMERAHWYGEALKEDRIWHHAAERGGFYTFRDDIFCGMKIAMASLAKGNPHKFSVLLEEFKHTPYANFVVLLFHGWGSNAESFGNEAALYLVQIFDNARHEISNKILWATNVLLSSISPFVSPVHLASLEQSLMNYYNDWELSNNGKRNRGYSQLILLQAINEDYLSQDGRTRLEELRRKFRVKFIEEHKSVGVQAVRSPIGHTQAEKMSDQQWINAMHKYGTDSVFEYRDGYPVGSVGELSRVLEQLSQKNPKRFVALSMVLPNEVNSLYFNAILSGISSADDPSTDLILELCKRCHNLPDRPCGSAIVRALKKLPFENRFVEVVEMLSWYAIEDQDPEKEWWNIEARDGQFYHGGNIFDAGLNTVRGHAAGAIADLLFDSEQWMPHFLPILRKMVHDTSIAVRSQVAEPLLALLKYDREEAVRLFSELCTTEEDGLLGTHYVEHFIYYVTETHFDALEPIITRMIQSINADVAQAGARRACLAALFVQKAESYVQQCLEGRTPLRLGAAEIFSANIGVTVYQKTCEMALKILFFDEDEKVQETAAHCFNNIEQRLGGFEDLIESFIESPSFNIGGYSPLLQQLENTPEKILEITLHICEKYIIKLEASQKTGNHSYTDERISILLIRVYTQAENESFQTKCLDFVDRIISAGGYRLLSLLDEYER